MKSNRPVASPSLVGRVTPCAPRQPPARAKFPRRRLPDPLPIKTCSGSIGNQKSALISRVIAKPLCFSLKLLFFRCQPKRNSLPVGMLREILTSSF
jgi:hypothetical protein